MAEFKGEDISIDIESATWQFEFFGPSHNISSKVNRKGKLL